MELAKKSFTRAKTMTLMTRFILSKDKNQHESTKTRLAWRDAPSRLFMLYSVPYLLCLL
jgi:hypothetical protein